VKKGAEDFCSLLDPKKASGDRKKFEPKKGQRVRKKKILTARQNPFPSPQRKGLTQKGQPIPQTGGARMVKNEKKWVGVVQSG